MTPLVTAGVVVAALASVPLLSSNTYVPYLVALGMTYALPALGLNVIMGYGPDISLGQHGLFAVGAYGTAIAMAQWEVSFWLALVGGGVGAALLSGLVALPALRLHGLYLAIGTLAFGMVVHTVIQSGGDITGGRNGLPVVGLDLDDRGVYFTILATVVVAVIVYRAFVLGRYGQLLIALRDNKIGAQAMGVSVVRVKLVSFMLCGLLAGIGGGLYAVLVRYIASDSFDLNLSLLFVAMIVVGGSASVYGPIVGAAFVVALPELAKDLNEVHEIIFGAVIVLVMLFMRSGLAGLPRLVLNAVRSRARAEPAEDPSVRQASHV